MAAQRRKRYSNEEAKKPRRKIREGGDFGMFAEKRLSAMGNQAEEGRIGKDDGQGRKREKRIRGG